MLNVIIAVLTIGYILVAYVGPLVALGLSCFWAYQSYQADGGIGGAIATFIISGIVLLIGLMIAKRAMKWLMNKVDLGDEPGDTASGGKVG